MSSFPSVNMVNLVSRKRRDSSSCSMVNIMVGHRLLFKMSEVPVHITGPKDAACVIHIQLPKMGSCNSQDLRLVCGCS